VEELRLGDLRIAYTRVGDGPPLVLLHGGMEDGRSWRRQVDGLADEFTVLAWDAPGCGRSSDVPESWRMPGYADALASWLGAVGVERPHVLGLSWGSSLALELYRRHPQLPASLILASAYAGWAGSLSPEETSARLEGILAAADLPLEEALEAFPGVLSPGAPSGLLEELKAIWADNIGLRKPGGYRAMAHSMAEADLRDVLPRIEVPTLLLYGGLDQRSPLKVANELNERIASSRLEVIEGVGHSANAEAPEEFNARVRAFIRSVIRS
jgi:pimeloyl-ACP methyl ester carboxylesterase